MDVLVSRKVDKEKMSKAASAVISLLKEKLGLTAFEAYFVVENLYESFPKEELLNE